MVRTPCERHDAKRLWNVSGTFALVSVGSFHPERKGCWEMAMTRWTVVHGGHSLLGFILKELVLFCCFFFLKKGWYGREEPQKHIKSPSVTTNNQYSSLL